jgi:hypothetical protein
MIAEIGPDEGVTNAMRRRDLPADLSRTSTPALTWPRSILVGGDGIEPPTPAL